MHIKPSMQSQIFPLRSTVPPPSIVAVCAPCSCAGSASGSLSSSFPPAPSAATAPLAWSGPEADKNSLLFWTSYSRARPR